MTKRELAVVVALLSIAPAARGQGATAYERLVSLGVRPALVYDAEGFVDMSGGARRGATYLGNLNLELTLDVERLAGWRGATIFLDGLWIHGGQPSAFAGDVQGVSSMSAPRKWTLEEAWIQQNLFSNRFSILVGRYDLNSEFYRLHAANLFFNASFGVGPEFSRSGRAGPSIFPNTAVGARLAWKPADSFVLRAAVLDGVPVERPGWEMFAKGDGLLVVGETAFLYRPTVSDGQSQQPSHRFRFGRFAQLPPYQAKVAIGVWHYTAGFPDLSRTSPEGTALIHLGSSGAYAIGDTLVYADTEGRSLRAFGELGVGDSRVNRFGLFAGGGVALVGVIPGRKDDEVGLAVAAARNGSHYVEQQHFLGRPVDQAEVTLELTYLSPVTSWLSLQPDLQYVVRPNTDPTIPNALVGLIRVELSS
jgi:porin